MTYRAIAALSATLFAVARASALMLTVPPTSAPPGGPIDVLVVASETGNDTVGLQVDLSIPQDVLSFDGCSIDPTLAALGFLFRAGQSPLNPGKMRLVLLPTSDGLAAGARLPDGPVASCSGSVFSTARPGRVAALTLSNAMAADATARSLPVTVASGSVTITSPSAPPGGPVCAVLPPGRTAGSSLPLFFAGVVLAIVRETRRKIRQATIDTAALVALAAIASPILGSTAAAEAPRKSSATVQGRWALLAGGCIPGIASGCRTPDARQWHPWQAWDVQCTGSRCHGRVAFAGGTFVRLGHFQLERTRANRVQGLVFDENFTPVASARGRVYRRGLRGYLLDLRGKGLARFVLPAPPGMVLTAARDAATPMPQAQKSTQSRTTHNRGGER